MKAWTRLVEHENLCNLSARRNSQGEGSIGKNRDIQDQLRRQMNFEYDQKLIKFIAITLTKSPLSAYMEGYDFEIYHNSTFSYKYPLPSTSKGTNSLAIKKTQNLYSGRVVFKLVISSISIKLLVEWSIFF